MLHMCLCVGNVLVALETKKRKLCTTYWMKQVYKTSYLRLVMLTFLLEWSKACVLLSQT